VYHGSDKKFVNVKSNVQTMKNSLKISLNPTQQVNLNTSSLDLLASSIIFSSIYHSPCKTFYIIYNMPRNHCWVLLPDILHILYYFHQYILYKNQINTPFTVLETRQDKFFLHIKFGLKTTSIQYSFQVEQKPLSNI